MPVRYSFGIYDTLITVRHVHNGTYHTVRATDFAPYDKLKDPKALTAHIFATTARSIPTTITHTNPPPSSPKTAQLYPVVEQWAIAHNTELLTLDDSNVIK